MLEGDIDSFWTKPSQPFPWFLPYAKLRSLARPFDWIGSEAEKKEIITTRTQKRSMTHNKKKATPLETRLIHHLLMMPCIFFFLQEVPVQLSSTSRLVGACRPTGRTEDNTWTCSAARWESPGLRWAPLMTAGNSAAPPKTSVLKEFHGRAVTGRLMMFFSLVSDMWAFPTIKKSTWHHEIPLVSVSCYL